jgi:hypothetical protein
MHDNKPVREVSLDDLVSGITNHNKLLTAEARIKDMLIEIEVYKHRIKFLEEAGDRLAWLMLQGSSTEMKTAIWQWRELNPRKKDDGLNS